MVIRQHNFQNLIGAAVQPAKQTPQAVDSSSFAALLTSYKPVGTVQGIVQVNSSASPTSSSSPTSPTSTPPAPLAFVATFQQGATVTGPDGSKTALNPTELATPTTAQDVAKLLGGTVTQDTMGGGYSPSASTLEISVPGSSVLINAGLAANLFANYGTAQGSEAWRIINQDLGRDPMSTGPVS